MKDLDQYDASDPGADFDAIDTTRQASEDIAGIDQVDSNGSFYFLILFLLISFGTSYS